MVVSFTNSSYLNFSVVAVHREKNMFVNWDLCQALLMFIALNVCLNMYVNPSILCAIFHNF